MTNGAAAGGAAAAAAAIAQAIKASGAIIRVESADFETIITRTEDPLLVCARGGFFSKNYQYLTAYKGLIFFCKSSTPLTVPADTELIEAKRIWIPA
jgi:hypothetical protein